MSTKSVKIIMPFVAAVILVGVSTESSFAQCTTNCVPFLETFGITPTCGSPQNNTNAGIVNHTNLPYNGGGTDYPNDGQYSIRCDGAQVNWGWFGAGGTTMIDHTTDAAGQIGNYALINSIGGPTEYYHRTVSNLCANTTYNLTYYAGNLVRDNIYANLPSLSAYIFPAGTAVQAAYSFSGTGGTLLGSTGNIPSETSASGFRWNAYSYNFTTGAGQTSIDIILMSLFGNNAGYDFALDDISVTWVSGGGVSCTTPIELLSFTGLRVADNVVKLNWVTATERNNDYFIIERSADALHFAPLGNMKGRGTAIGAYSYAFIDSVAPERAYYRLKQVDMNGDYRYYDIIVSEQSMPHDIHIYPNPGHRVFDLSTPSYSGLGVIHIYDALGNLVHTTTVHFDSEVLRLDLQVLVPGVYIMEVYNSEHRRFEKFTIE